MQSICHPCRQELLGQFKERALYLLLLNQSSSSMLKEFLTSLPKEAFQNSNGWLVLDEKNQLDDVHFPIDSLVFAFRASGKDEIEIEEVYSVTSTSKILHLASGRWLIGKGLSVNKAPLEERRKDVQGLVLRAQTIHQPPNNQLIGGKIEGFLGDIWHGVLEPKLNFSTDLKQPKDGQYGIPRENGEGWTGAIGALVANEADLALGSFSVTFERSKVVEFGPGISECVSRFFIKFPEQRTNWLTYLMPFSNQLWISLAMMFIAFSSLLFVLYLFGQEKNWSPNSFTPGNLLLLVWGSWLAQGTWINPRSASLRISILATFCFGILIYTAYSAKLISFLSVTKPRMPFSSMEELLDQKEYSFGMVKGSSRQGRWGELLTSDKENLVDGLSEGLQKAWAEQYAFLACSTNVRNHLSQQSRCCDFLEVCSTHHLLHPQRYHPSPRFPLMSALTS